MGNAIYALVSNSLSGEGSGSLRMDRNVSFRGSQPPLSLSRIIIGREINNEESRE